MGDLLTMRLKIRRNKTDSTMVELTSVMYNRTYVWAVVHEDFILELAGHDRDKAMDLDTLLDEGPNACIEVEVSVI